MIRKLRIKFICINMAIVTLMLCVIFGLIFHFTSSNLEEESAGLLQAVALEPVDLVSVFTAVATCINNVGPGLEIVGPMGNFSSFSHLSKLLLSFDMLVGRLEVFPMLLLFAPSIWKRRRPSRKAVSAD